MDHPPEPAAPVGERPAYVAIHREHADAALRHLQRTPIKGRRLAVQRVD